jgi:hypothetical protein
MSLTTLVCALAVLAADPSAEDRPGRRYHEIERDLTAALKREAAAKDLVERGAAVRQLVAVYDELKHDPRTPTAPGLKEYAGKIRGRLVSVQKRLKQELARGQQAAKRSSSELLDIVADRDQLELSNYVAAQVSLAGYALGGPAQVFDSAGGAFGGGAVNGDFGQDLVDLIERTISPNSWAVNGGVCTIVYYRPLMCLVVRATGDTHRDVGGLLDGLRSK